MLVNALRLSVLSLVLFAALPASAQTTTENLEKYHALRARLLTEFTVVGEGPGESQPADLRDDGEGFIKWADSTIRLGWYLGLLATERHIYENPELYPGAAPEGPESTLEELHHALLALERIDRVADAAFPLPCTQTEELNGFFLRDDVPDGFHANFPPTTVTYSDFVDPVLTNKEMSQDQVYHLLIGLALVKRFVPVGVSYEGRDLSTWAVVQAQRIIEHVERDGWTIMNPACDRAVNRGEAAAGFSGGTRLAIGFITDGEYVPEVADIWINVWELAKESNFLAYSDVDNRHMAMSIAAVGDGWGESTSEDLARLGEPVGWPFYALLHRALHGDAALGWCRSGEGVNEGARVMLDELPLGAETASPWPNTGPHGFTRTNRFMRGTETAYTGEDGSDGYRFNGMDYLLLHNLYAIATPSTWDGGGGPGIPSCDPPPPGSGGGGVGGGGGGGGETTAPPGAEGSDGDAGCSCRAASGSGRAGHWAVLALALIARRRRQPKI